jgi:uncharacterized protein
MRFRFAQSAIHRFRPGATGHPAAGTPDTIGSPRGFLSSFVKVRPTADTPSYFPSTAFISPGRCGKPCRMSVSYEEAYAPFASERERLTPAGAAVLDAHTHLGVDEDGQSLSLERLLGLLDEVGPATRACVFALHDPDRRPAYRLPNERIFGWAEESGGRLVPYCRLDPADDPVAEAKRCLARGARGIKLHPRAQSFGFDDPSAQAIFEIARGASVPILIHAGRGMPTMAPLAELAIRYPEVGLILAHGAVADQGIFATRLAGHPRVVYDTSCFSPVDLVELFARVPAERIVYGSDTPYGQPAWGLYLALRAAMYAGLDETERALMVGTTMNLMLDGLPLPDIGPPRLASTRPCSGPLSRVSHYLQMAFAAFVSGGARPDPARALPWIELARAACRDPDPGGVEEPLARIDDALAHVEQFFAAGGRDAFGAMGLLMAAAAVAATELLDR